jgi:hypothetical protein
MKTGILLTLSGLSLVWAADPDYESIRRKFDLIEQDRLRPGTHVVLTSRELNAYARQSVAEAVPDGVREPRLELTQNTAVGTALIDFAKVQRAQGNPPGWLMSQLLEGERPVRVTVRVDSAHGKATVDVQSVEVSGMSMQGAVLDFLIRNYLLPRYPDARIGQPFSLAHRIDRIEVQPGQTEILIGR